MSESSSAFHNVSSERAFLDPDARQHHPTERDESDNAGHGAAGHERRTDQLAGDADVVGMAQPPVGPGR